MLTDKRIKEAERNTKTYLAEGLLKRSTDDVAKNILYKNAYDSLKAAQLLIDNHQSLWTIVTSYYAMFYMANAVLLATGYKTQDKIVHKVTADALIAIIRKKLKDSIISTYEEVREEALDIAEIKSGELTAHFDFERRKRNSIQYHTTNIAIAAKAKTSLQRATTFLFEMEALM